MLVWQGWGILVVAIPFAVIAVVSAIWTAMFGSAAAREGATLMLGVALLVSAPLVYLLGKRLDARPGRTMIDKDTGQEIVLRGAHTLFFVPVRYWAWIGAGLAVILLVVGMLPQST